MDKFIIEDKIIFCSVEHKLTPSGSIGVTTGLHTPTSRILLLLLQNPGKPVSKEFIIKEVWEKYGQLVNLNTLYQNISLLRKGLKGAGALSSKIKTIPKFGFVFVGNVKKINHEHDSYSPLLLQEVGLKQSTTDLIQHKSEIQISNLDIKKTLIIFYVTVSAFVIIFSLKKISNSRDNFVYAHKKIARIGECNIYIDKNNFKKKWGNYIQLLSNKNLNCKMNDFYYITKTKKKSENILIMHCDSYDNDFLSCETHFKIKDNLIADLLEKNQKELR